MKKIIFLLTLIVMVFLVGIALVLGSFGLVPGISSILVKQRDLEVEPDQQQVVDINSNLGREISLSSENLPYSGQPVYEGKVEISDSYSDQQVTSVLDSWVQNWSITPFSNSQVKINSDGTAETSFILKIQPAIFLAKQLGYNDEQISQASKYATFIQGNVPVYAVGTVSVVDNKVSLSLSKLEIGRVAIPSEITSKVSTAIEDAVERRISSVTNLQVKNLDLNGGKLNIEGTVPQTERGE